MPVHTQHRFSVTDYYRMAESGVLGPDARVELLEGRIVEMSPIGSFHGGVVNRLGRRLQLAAKGRWLVSVQNPLRLDNHSEPEPDMMLLRPAPDDYISRHPQPEDVFLLSEVSDTTLDYDRVEKLPANGRAGVIEVWIVDLTDATIEVYREPHFRGYASKKVLRAGDSAEPQAFPEVVVEVGELLRR